MSAADDKFDSEADEAILACLNIEKPRSFFLYAGAGSGKTRSLVEAIRTVCKEQGRRLSLSGQKIGVITYTNAACDEIKQRLEFDPRVEVSTIHAFAWSLIAGYDGDIRGWLSTRLLADIAELEEAQAKGRASSKAASDRARSIESKRRRRENLAEITRFVYSPTGDNRTRDSLNHAEVIAMTADFLSAKPGLRRLLVTRFPILLIDESQDTSRRLMDALLDVEAGYREAFCLGLFGDTMQRIYADGKERLAEAIPQAWARPRKRMNHRCPTRVITLINKIRRDEDGEEQQPRSDAETGVVRLFVVSQVVDKGAAEATVVARMAEITGDRSWAEGAEAIKTLALEHLMSARRFGFEQFFEPLYAVERIRTSFLQGTGAGIGLFTREILPLVAALREGDRFAVAAVVRRTSPLLERNALEAAGEKQVDILSKVKAACDGLLALVTENPTARSVLRYVAETDLFTIPEVLVPFSAADAVVAEGEIDTAGDAGDEDEEVDVKSELGGWRLALESPFDQIERYDRYVRGISQFDTHQGVKGLEFPRVMVVVSDDEARGFMFAYDKLFATKAKSKTDLENEAAGKETTIDRTRRLFYVTCSRAEQSLAVVYYTADPTLARDAMIRQEWFEPGEIELIA
jgi:DNA helicase II / ATP-dependent DNA helicase PcrA